MSQMKKLLPELKGHLLEICVGDEYEEIILADSVKKANGAIYGVLKDIVEDFLVIDSFSIDKQGNLRNGNIIYINTWAVKMFTRVDSRGCLNDVLLSSDHTRKIKRLLGIDE